LASDIAPNKTNDYEKNRLPHIIEDRVALNTEIDRGKIGSTQLFTNGSGVKLIYETEAIP
jgi:hypothetical protein